MRRVPKVTEDICRLYGSSDAIALAQLVARKEVHPAELMEAAIAAAEELDPQLGVLAATGFERAREIASLCNSTGPLAGIPFLAKDLLPTSVIGLKTTNGSRFYQRHASPATEDSEIIRRSRHAGLISFGLTKTPETDSALTTEPAVYGPSRNPWNTDYTTGGSSGGSAAAVAARIVPLASASDGGGSIRVPAAMSGTVGLKPTRGRVPIAPLMDSWYGSSVNGCVSRTVRDTAAYLDAVSGPCTGDTYTPPAPVLPFLQLSTQDARRLMVGFTTTVPFGYTLDPEIAAAVTSAAHMLEGMGHDVARYDLNFAFEANYHARNRITAVLSALQFNDAAAKFGVELQTDDVESAVHSQIDRGKSVDAITHARDIDTVRRTGRDFCVELSKFDVFLCPVMPQRTGRLGWWSEFYKSDVEAWIALFSFLFPVNSSGLPAISLPLSEATDGLPLGVQFVGRYGEEATLLQLATALEEQVAWGRRLPPIRA